MSEEGIEKQAAALLQGSDENTDNVIDWDEFPMSKGKKSAGGKAADEIAAKKKTLSEKKVDNASEEAVTSHAKLPKPMINPTPEELSAAMGVKPKSDAKKPKTKKTKKKVNKSDKHEL